MTSLNMMTSMNDVIKCFYVNIFGNDIIKLLYLFLSCIRVRCMYIISGTCSSSSSSILLYVDILRSIDETNYNRCKLEGRFANCNKMSEDSM